MIVLSTGCLLVGQQAPPESSATFHSETELVLTTFNVIRGIYFAPDVKRDDVVLLEDGKPRDFTVFEGPGGRRPPLELVLLFDTTTIPPPESKIVVRMTHWDRKATYDFTNHWGDAESRAVLEKNGADVRVSVYHFDHQQLQRLCPSTKDPQTLTSAIHRLPEPMPANEGIALQVPKDRRAMPGFDSKVLNWPLSWTLEAAIETLNDSNTAPANAIRALVVFSETTGPTTTQPQDAADAAVALGIRVYPVVLDYDAYVQRPFATGIARGGKSLTPEATPMSREAAGMPQFDPMATSGIASSPVQTAGNLSVVPMVRFGSLGQLTGGGSLYPSRMDAETVNHILDIVRDEGLSQYVVGFVPPPSARQRTHNLEVKLKSKSSDKLASGKRTAVY